MLSLFQIFESWSSLKLNLNKSELCGIGVKKGVDLAFCGCKVVNLDKETVKILGAHFSYNMSLVDSRNFVETISKMKEILSIWSHRALTLIGRISVFKILALSKVLYISSMKTVPKFITEKLDNLQKSFVWKSKKPKIKHSTLIRDYSEGSLKEVDIKSKIVALQLTWIRRLNDGNFHPWKLIPLNVLKPPGGSAVFHQNLDLTPNYQMHSLVSIETYCPTGVKIFPTILIQKVRFLQSISGTINIFELITYRNLSSGKAKSPKLSIAP